MEMAPEDARRTEDLKLGIAVEGEN